MNKAEIVKSTAEYIETQLKNDFGALSLDNVADKIGYSKFYLNRIFREETGVTIHRYILERRITKAAEKLVYTDKPIADIAYETGYNSQQTFTNVFSSVYPYSPMKYRNNGNYIPYRNPYQQQSAVYLYTCRSWEAAA